MRPSLYKKGVLAHESRDMDPIKKRLTDSNIRLTHAAFGLTTETGELVDNLKKHIFYGSVIDIANIKEEVGDLMWYINIILDVFDWSLEEVLELNNSKLMKRYGEKFSEECAIHRNLDEERKILEDDIES
jgi:NTP pyrophosphatase (non-canonical NTP hydrolase)